MFLDLCRHSFHVHSYYIFFFPILQALPTCAKEVIELLDILLRWFVLRLCESNTTCLLKVTGSLLGDICFYAHCKLSIYKYIPNFICALHVLTYHRCSLYSQYKTLLENSFFFIQFNLHELDYGF